MKNPSRLYILFLIAFILAAIAFLIYRWLDDAEARQKIYGAAPRESTPVLFANGIHHPLSFPPCPLSMPVP
jgi:hypothetical protein